MLRHIEPGALAPSQTAGRTTPTHEGDGEKPWRWLWSEAPFGGHGVSQGTRRVICGMVRPESVGGGRGARGCPAGRALGIVGSRLGGKYPPAWTDHRDALCRSLFGQASLRCRCAARLAGGWGSSSSFTKRRTPRARCKLRCAPSNTLAESLIVYPRKCRSSPSS